MDQQKWEEMWLLKRLARLHKFMLDSVQRRYGLTGDEITKEAFIAKGLAAWRDRKCPYCGDILHYKKISPDHIYPQFLGGSSGAHNILFVCRDCNMEKSFLPLDVYLETHPETRVGKERFKRLGHEYFKDDIRKQQSDRARNRALPGTERLFVKKIRKKRLTATL